MRRQMKIDLRIFHYFFLVLHLLLGCGSEGNKELVQAEKSEEGRYTGKYSGSGTYKYAWKDYFELDLGETLYKTSVPNTLYMSFTVEHSGNKVSISRKDVLGDLVVLTGTINRVGALDITGGISFLSDFAADRTDSFLGNSCRPFRLDGVSITFTESTAFAKPTIHIAENGVMGDCGNVFLRARLTKDT